MLYSQLNIEDLTCCIGPPHALRTSKREASQLLAARQSISPLPCGATHVPTYSSWHTLSAAAGRACALRGGSRHRPRIPTVQRRARPLSLSPSARYPRSDTEFYGGIVFFLLSEVRHRVLWGNRFFLSCTRHVSTRHISMYLRHGIVIHSFFLSVPQGIIFY